MTQVTEPIRLDCSTRSLEIFIKLVGHYDTLTDDHDAEFEEALLMGFTDDELINLVQDICILDSDFFLESIADLILRRIEEMDWKKMQQYLGLESDFTRANRKLIAEFGTEYLISVNTDAFTFPFPDTRFASLKCRFPSPMNSLLAQIVRRSRDITAWNLSIINKAMKNETDRHPIKLTSFQEGIGYRFYVKLKSFVAEKDYFDAIKKRKVTAERFKFFYQLYKGIASFSPPS